MLISNPWPAVIARSAAGAALVLFLGLISGYLLQAIAVGAVILLSYNLLQLYRLEAWLRLSRKRRPPRAGGLWGNVFDGLDRRHQRQRVRRYRLVRLLRRFRESVDAMPDGTIVLTGSGEMDWWNHLATRYLGLHWPQDRGQRIANLIRHPDFASYLERGDPSSAVKIPSPQDSRRTLEIRIVPYGQDQQLLLARDISELHRLETMRRDFVANISHELRTPLTVLRGMSEQLSEFDDLGPEDLERPLVLMEQQIERMTRLVDDLLLLSRLETEAPVTPRSLVSFSNMLEDIVEEARAMSGGAHVINLIVDNGLTIAGDEEELRSASLNLLSNAVKYTERGGRIDVRWFEAAGGACLTVADTGRGIPLHHLPRLTERFYRVDSGRASRNGGTGLGLAIVKHVLSRHSARLEVTSEVGEGSTFSAIFPVYERLDAAPNALQTGEP